MSQSKKIFILSCLFLSACFFKKPPILRQSPSPLTTVEFLDLERYLGVWHEVARFRNSFQDFKADQYCVNTTATYSKTEDPELIEVLNRCQISSNLSDERVAKGTAKVLDLSSKAKLGVKFFFLAPRSNYWVLALGSHYEYAVIGEPEGRYLWILSRERPLSTTLVEEALSKTKALGYDTSKLRFDPIYKQQP